MSQVVELEGRVTGVVAEVAGNHALRTSPGTVSVATAKVSVATGGTTILSSREGRLALTLQNLDAANAVHVVLAAQAAATGDLRIDPGAVFTLPAGVAYEGEVRGKSVTATVDVVAVEYYTDVQATP